MTAKRIINTYFSLTIVTTLSQSLIWGVNTLFLLSVGLNIFQIMVVNAAFTFGEIIFQIPTGVIADAIGRRASYLLSTFTIFVSTILYLVVGLYMHGNIGMFILASVLVGLGFTFYTGAVDAWMVDALHFLKYEGSIDAVFARYGIAFGASMLIGATAGGFLGQIALWIPYAVRALFLIPAFFIGLIFMKEFGYTPKAAKLSKFAGEAKKIATAGVNFGFKDRVVRFLMLSTFVQGLFFIYGFYSWQKYFLDLLGHNLIWVAGIIAALVGLAQIFGSLLVKKVIKVFKDRANIIIYLTVIQTVVIIVAALTHNFYLAVSMYLISTVSFGILFPIKRTWLNSRIPSEQRATLLSLDAFFENGGGTVGQLGLGYLSQMVSIPFAWLVGGALQVVGVPLVLKAKSEENNEKNQHI